MTGNNKVWRAPVAGLASVAMLATLGVTAMTASAATDTYYVKLHANGGVFNTQQVGGNSNVVSADENTITIKTTVKDTLNRKTIDQAIIDAVSGDGNDDNGYLYGEGKNLAAKAENFFTGWYASAAPGAAVDPNSALTGDIDLYAHWSEDAVTVTFVGNGVSGDDIVDVAPSDTVADWQIPGDFAANDDKLINYWASQANQDKPVYPDQLTAQELHDSTMAGQSESNDVRLVAVPYASNQVHNVTFTKGGKNLWIYADAADATADWNSYSYDVVEGTQITAPLARYEEDPSKLVTAWRAENDKNDAVFPKTVNQDYVFKAVDNAHGYTVNFWSDWEEKVQTGAALQLISSTTVGEDEAVAKPADPTRDGYAFVGWVDYNGVAWNFSNNVSNDNTYNGVLNLYAKWTKAAASVNFHPNSDDEETKITKSFTTGDKFTAPEVTKNGYVLVGWYSDAELTAEVNYFGRTVRLVRGNTADQVTLQYALSDDKDDPTGVGVSYQPVASDLYAKWKRADESAIKDQEAVTPASLLYTAADPKKPYLSKSKYFTTESFNEFTDWYDSTYLPAKQAAQTNGYTTAEAAELVTMLQEAQSKLVFKTDVTVWRFEKDGKHIYAQGKEETDNLLADGWKHETFGDLHTVDPTVPAATKAALLTEVARLREKATGQYMLTADQNEIDVLTGDGSWKNETFSAIYAPKNGTTPVYRLYLKYNNEHLVTADANEYNTQVKDTANFHGDGVKFYLY